jgi:hypothetical protein
MPGGALTNGAERLRAEAADTFPEKTSVSARGAVHGRYGNVRPRCGAKGHRIR